MPRLLVVGSMNADVFLQVPRLPLVGETISAHPEARVFPGGKGANTAVCAARLLPTAAGGEEQQHQRSVVRFACQLGSDAHYAPLLSTLQAAGVDASLVRQVAGSTGAAFILMLPGGDNSIVLAGGANQAWALPLPAELQAAVREADCVLLQREIPDAVNAAVAAVLQAEAEAEGGSRRQRRVLLDVGGSVSPLSSALLRHVLWLAPNETELSGLTGLPTDSKAAMLDAARAALRQLGDDDGGDSGDGMGMLLTAGSQGSFLLVPQPQQQPPLCIHCPAYKVDVVDSTGAGDAFRG